MSKKHNKRERSKKKSTITTENNKVQTLKKILNVNLTYPSGKKRLKAWLIDFGISFVVMRLCYLLPGESKDFSFPAFYFVFASIYYIGFWAWKSATPGMFFMKLKLINDLEDKITLYRYFQKYFLGYIDVITLGITCLIFRFFTQKKQCIGEKIAHLIVIEYDYKENFQDFIFFYKD